MVKNGTCLEGARTQNALFSKKCAPKNAPMPSLSRIGPAGRHTNQASINVAETTFKVNTCSKLQINALDQCGTC